MVLIGAMLVLGVRGVLRVLVRVRGMIGVLVGVREVL